MNNLNINDVIEYIKKNYGLNARVEYTDNPDSFEKIFGIDLTTRQNGFYDEYYNSKPDIIVVRGNDVIYNCNVEIGLAS